MSRFAVLAILIASLSAGCASVPDRAQQQPGMQAPERATGYSEKEGWYATRFMVAAANPHAVEAGYQVLKRGGSAIDAAIAVQMVLNLVEPQSSGIGGGAFLLHFDGENVQAYDGRETAPAAVDRDLFLNADGKVMDFRAAVVGGRSVGVPGVLRMLELAHREHGRLPWADLFQAAITLAERGFPVSPRLNAMLTSEQHLQKDPVAAAYFYDAQGRPWPTGHILKNPELARTLRSIAADGANAFYSGDIAHAIVSKVQGHPTNPGTLTASDLAAYQARLRQPVCTTYRIWIICGMPPPSSGGIAVAQILGILEYTDIARFPPQQGVPDATAVHLFSEAGRLAYADRNRYVADPDFAPPPHGSYDPLLDGGYLARRAALIGKQSMDVAEPGNPFERRLANGRDAAPELPSTSQVSIVDADGNAVSMTTTIEDAFGARQMVRGFLLNNQLTDFSFVAVDADGPVANRVQPGKRPRSSMAPTLVFDGDSGRLLMVTGSPGGSAIINYVAKVLVAGLDWKLDAQQAVNLPNFGSRNGPTELEEGRFPPAVAERLRARGHNLRLMEQTSGLQTIMRRTRNGEPVWFGAADPRREGIAKGD